MSHQRGALTVRDVLIFLALQALVVATVVFFSAQVKAAESASAEKIYAVIVAHNGSVDPGVRPLKYADDDGARYWEIFSSMTDDVTLLTTLDPDSQAIYSGVVPHTQPPTRAGVLRALRQVQSRLKADRDEGVRSSLFVVFAGHGAVDDSGMGYLSLLDGRFTRQDLMREVISPDLAERTHLIIDACNAYFMVHERGGAGERGETSDWRDDRSGQTRDAEFSAFLGTQGVLARYPRVGVLLSTAGAAEVHEWSEYRAGVFSHEVRSGLLGAADVDGDKAVTYPELEAYLEAANASVQDPRARIQVFTEAPRQFQEEPLMRLGRLERATFLEITPEMRGRYHIADSRGVRYADFHSAGDGAFHLALLQNAPIFFIRTEAEEARVVPERSVVRLAELDFVARDGVRGPVEESYRANLFALPYGRGFYAGFHAGRSRAGRAAGAVVADVEPQRALRALGLRTAYVVSSSQLSRVDGIDSGVQHNTELAVDLWFSEHVALEIFAQFGSSSPLSTDAGETIVARRAAGGVGVRGDWRLGRSPLRIEVGLRTAHQGLWATYEANASADASLRGDPFSWRAEALVGLVMPVARGWEVGARAGASVSVFSFTERQDEAPTEIVDVLPFGGLTLGYRFD